MTGLRFFAVVFFLLANHRGFAAERWIPFKVVAADEVNLSGLSEMGSQILKQPDRWMIGQSDHFTAFVFTRLELTKAIDDAENARMHAREWLNIDTGTTSNFILVFIDDNKMWSRAVKAYGIRPDGLAMQVGRELYFKDEQGQEIRPDRIAHEVFHLCLAESFARRIPLWLDEGLASFYGWRSAVEINTIRGNILTRNLPAVNVPDLWSPDDLLSMQQYPDNPERAQAFYRQSEELVAVLCERLGPDGMPAFVKAMCAKDAVAPAQFRLATGLAENDVTGIMEEVRRRCLIPHTSEP